MHEFLEETFEHPIVPLPITLYRKFTPLTSSSMIDTPPQHIILATLFPMQSKSDSLVGSCNEYFFLEQMEGILP